MFTKNPIIKRIVYIIVAKSNIVFIASIPGIEFVKNISFMLLSKAEMIKRIIIML